MDTSMVTLTSGSDYATIAYDGGVLTDWVVTDHHGQVRHLVDGYRDEDELHQRDGSRNAVLAPWSNRIRDAVFTFDGQRFDQGPGPSGIREAIHGLVTQERFQEEERGENWVRLGVDVPVSPTYPFHIHVSVTYTLIARGREKRLDMSMQARNMADGDAPVTLGWHPYMTYQGTGRAMVRVPAATQIVTDPALIPLPGSQAFSAGDDAPVVTDGLAEYADSIGYVVARPHDLDHAFTDLKADEDGWVRVRLTHPDGTTTMMEWKPDTIARGVGIVQLFTGDGLGVRPGQALAIEPCLAMTDAFNREECADFIRLHAHEERALHAALVFCEHTE